MKSLPSTEEESLELFINFSEKSYWPLCMHILAVAIVGMCIVGGIRWIELFNMVLVPLLLSILFFTFGWSLTRDYADVGIAFLFTPDWKSLTEPGLWVAAASQNAFDTGAAMALFISYSAFFSRSNGAVRFGSTIPFANNTISLICAITIFSTVFSTFVATSPTLTRAGILSIMQQTGPGSTGLTFTWIPVLYANFGITGRVLCAAFFLCLSCAGITSLIGHVQLTAVTVKDFGYGDRHASIIALGLTLVFGIPSALYLDVLRNQDSVWGFGLMLSGLAMAVLVLVYGPFKYRRVIVNDFGIGDWHLPVVWVFMISVLVPLTGIGLIVWWAYDSITSDEYWFHLTTDSFVTTLLEWSVLLTILIVANIVGVVLKKDLFAGNTSVGYNPYTADYVPTNQLADAEAKINTTDVEPNGHAPVSNEIELENC